MMPSTEAARMKKDYTVSTGVGDPEIFPTLREAKRYAEHQIAINNTDGNVYIYVNNGDEVIGDYTHTETGWRYEHG